MKSEKAKQYLLKVVTPIAMMYPDCPGECDIKLIEAKRAIELAEQEAEERMRRKAAKAYCQDCCCTVVGECKCGIGSENCVALRDFIQKLDENEND
jgi:hypothetical protein